MFGKRIPEISVSDLYRRINNKDNILMIDIRKPTEWVQTGVIEGSKLITDEAVLKGIDFGDLGKDLAGKEVIIICRSGNRSSRMTDFLTYNRDLETKSIINMVGGIIDWKRHGYPVVQPTLSN